MSPLEESLSSCPILPAVLMMDDDASEVLRFVVDSHYLLIPTCPFSIERMFPLSSLFST